MSGNEQQEEPLGEIAAADRDTKADGLSAGQVPVQAVRGPSGGAAEGGTVLPGPWPAVAEEDASGEAAGAGTGPHAVPQQRAGR
ncbi:hypothetical protein GA0115253_107611, partial [Streptomyces sp. Termitarium-T10T-6]